MNQKPSAKEAKIRSTNRSEILRDSFSLTNSQKELGKNLNAHIITYGCQANVRDSETMRGILTEMGYAFTEDAQMADLIILNTCAIRQNAEDRVLGQLGYLKKYKDINPELVIALAGCMSQEESVISMIEKSYPQVDIVFGTHNIADLPSLLERHYREHTRVIQVYSKEGDVVEQLPVLRDLSHKAWVNIMYGCDKFCTYCIVPMTRGKQRSRLKEDILSEILQLKEQGCREVTLLGQNVDAYGKDLGNTEGFSELLEAVAETKMERIRFTTSHPWDFTRRTVDVMADYDNIMPFLHLPVQSGDNEILKIMGRRYTVEQYKEQIDYLRERIPECALSTDIIVGFPNETEEQFKHTLDLYDYCRYDNAFTFIFSPRANTPAAAMEDSVPYEEKQKRLLLLNEKVDYYAEKANQAYIGRKVKVLVDGISKKNDKIVSGYSESNKLVHFRDENYRVGDIVTVKITGAKSFYLEAEKEE